MASDIVNARIGVPTLTQSAYVEVIQGEDRSCLFIVEGRFDDPTPADIIVKFRDVESVQATVENADIERLCEDEEIQVFRLILPAADTILFTPGLLRVEIRIDTQRAVLTQSMKVIETIVDEGS